MMGPYLKVQTRRGGGKTEFALLWARARVLAGCKHLLLAAGVPSAADRLRDELRRRDPELFQHIRLQTACPQRDEFRLYGSNYDAAIAEDIDIWPTHPLTGRSVLFEEILAHTRGSVLFTYTDTNALLAQQIPSST